MVATTIHWKTIGFFLIPNPLSGFSCLKTILYLRQEDGGLTEHEKVAGADQLWAPTHCEEWKVHTAVQENTEND